MTQFDLRTQAWLQDIRLYCGGNTNDPAKLKENVTHPSEWAERLKRNFSHVLAEQVLTAMDYEDETDISFDEDAELYAYLWRLYNYLFENGPFPDWT